MLRRNRLISYCLTIIGLFFSALLSSCSTQSSTNTSIIETQAPESVSFTKAEVEVMERCWLKLFGTDFDQRVDNGQCTALASLLTKRTAYGADANGESLGGYEYIKLQESKGIIISKLGDVKDEVKPCDNLVLIGPNFDDIGHTVVVFRVDLVNDTIYYLDQNYAGQGIRPRTLIISQNQNNAYVLPFDCKIPADSPCDMDPLTVQSIEIDQAQDPQITSMMKIAFDSNRDGNSEIYVMDADGSNQMRVTNNQAQDAAPSWSPDGLKIVFVSDRNGPYVIFVMNADGSEQTQLINNANFSNPDWSPNGEKIVFALLTQATSNIQAMNMDGSNRSGLNDQFGDQDPSWSPDGMNIVFVSDRDNGQSDIYIMDADGSNQFRLTNDQALDSDPSWSPDGKKIVFASRRDENTDIFVMNTDGSGQIRLTTNPSLDDRPVWSPDSSMIAFVSNRDGNDEIYVMYADGSNQTRLTNNLASDSNPAWAR